LIAHLAPLAVDHRIILVAGISSYVYGDLPTAPTSCLAIGVAANEITRDVGYVTVVGVVIAVGLVEAK
jgi:uncharacterized membrane protein YczE